MRHLVVGTAGHIDHGKTTLVHALTGVDTDRLPEEKQRGITIELGFAPWRIDAETRASIIDVPGHERLVRTMVAGCSGIDVGLLVVAADDGVMPQTREHVDVLRFMGLERLVVVITKIDLSEPGLVDLVEEELRELLAPTPFAKAPLVRVSARTGVGLEALRLAVARAATALAPRSADGPAFLPLDRVFQRTGFGVIAAGTLLRGALSVESTIEALDDGGGGGVTLDDLRIRGLESQGEPCTHASAGRRVAVNVSGKDASLLLRGMVLAKSSSFRVVSRVVAELTFASGAELLQDAIVTCHLGTTDRQARVLPLAGKRLQNDGAALLLFDRPVALFAGQRLVLRKPGNRACPTLAGGKVLDTHPVRGKGARASALKVLPALRGSPQDALLGLLAQSRASGLSLTELWQRLPPGDDVSAILVENGKAALHEGRLYLAAELDRIGSKLQTLVDTLGRESLGDVAEATVLTQLPPPERQAGQLALWRAVQKGVLVQAAGRLRLPGKSEQSDPQRQHVIDALLAAGLSPPGDEELSRALAVPLKRVRELLSALVREQELVRVAPDHYVSRKHIDDLRHRLLEFFQTRPELSPRDFKLVCGGLSRKWAIPLLEYFDRERVTTRKGDSRRLHPVQTPTIAKTVQPA